MARMTIEQQLVTGLAVLGYTETKRTTHYRVFISPDGEKQQRRYYVGRNGAFRMSFSGRVTDTHQCAAKFRDTVLARCADHLGLVLEFGQ